jgi:4-amino-4-deoxy-L-arabinose transferase-like glycosyltransferase
VSVARLLLLFGTAVGIRILFTVAYRGDLQTVPVRNIAGADGVEYDLLARNTAAGKGYVWNDGTPTSFRAPGFPLFLAAIYSLFGDSYKVAYISFACWGGIGVVFTFLLARELLSNRLAWYAGIFACLYPPDIFCCSYFYSEIVFSPLLGAGLYLLELYRKNGSRAAVFISGIVLGYAALARSFAILLLPLFALRLLRTNGRPGFVTAAVFTVGFLAAIMPWTVRNYCVHHQFVLTATNGGSTFYGGNNPVVAGRVWEYGNWVSTTKLPGRDLIDAQPDEVSHDKMEWKLGIDWVSSHPAKFVVLGVFKEIRFWLPFCSYPSFKIYPIANITLTTPFLIFIFVGLFRSVRRYEDRRHFGFLHLTMIASFVMVFLFWGHPGFRDANAPVLMVYAALGFDSVLSWFGSPKGTVPGPEVKQSTISADGSENQNSIAPVSDGK